MVLGKVEKPVDLSSRLVKCRKSWRATLGIKRMVRTYYSVNK